MKRTFEEAVINRRSYYQIDNHTPVSDDEIVRVLHEVVRHVPSAFNSQTTRIVLLLGKEHRKLWQIVKDTLQRMIPEDAFIRSKAKIDGSFASGYGTVLFFEDTSTIRQMEGDFPLYAKNFQVWSQHTSAMHQFTIWTFLEELGFGASLQHYNPLIDNEVKHTWHLPNEWMLIAQMPFGMPLSAPEAKSVKPVEERVWVFKN